MLRSVFSPLLVLLAWLTAAGPVMAGGDADQGKALFSRCDACHQVGEGARNSTGPVLNNIVGRRAATRTGYIYSRGMREAGAEGLVWTAETLDAYITNPRRFVRGTRMAYAGMRDEQARQDLIAYLGTLKIEEMPEEDRTFR